MRLFHNRYIVGGLSSPFKDIKFEKEKTFTLRRLSKELTITGFYGPIVLVSIIINMLQWVVLFYFITNLIGILVVIKNIIYNPTK